MISCILNAIHLWTWVSGNDQLGTINEENMWNPVSTKDPAVLYNDQKVTEGRVEGGGQR